MDSSIVKIIDVNVNEIIPNRFQPRRQFDEEEIMELSESIRKYGVIQPLVVRPTGDKYEIIAGERRYKASVLAGLEYIPVIVKNLTDKDSAELAIIENIQRRNLSAIEEALSYKKVLDMGYLTQEDLASKIGKSQPTIANKIRLLNLSDEVQEALLENKISERHARSLLRLSDIKEQNEMLERIINERLTVRKTDDEINKIKEEESGEIEMNGETSIPEMPAMESLPVSPSVNSMPTFDMFGTNDQNNVVATTPEAPAQPEFVMPQMPAPEAPAQPEFVMPQMPAPEAPAQPGFAMPQMPAPEAPAQPGFAMPQMPAPEAPAQPGFAMPQMPAPEAPAQPEFAMPQMPAPEVPAQPEFAMPQMPAPEVPAQPEFAMPQMPAPEVPAQPEFAMPQMPAPEVPAQPEFAMPQMPAPEVPVQPEFAMPQMPAPEAPVQPEIESVSDISPTSPQVSMPTTSPIIEQPEPVVPQMPVQPEVPAQPEFTMPQMPETPVQETISESSTPEPIIVTDYSKQYDPVMPNVPTPIQKVDFKSVIDAIRECSSKIEQFGYTIDVEEYDLANLYQVVFKIEK